MIRDALITLLGLVNEMSPFLLIGFLFAGLLHVLVPKKFYRKYLAPENFKSVALASLFGVPLPLCSCGVIPTAMSLRAEGVSRSATIAFLTATPQTGIDSILATYAVFGMAFAVVRPIAALIIALLTGLIATFVFRKQPETQVVNNTTCDLPASNKKTNKVFSILKYGYFNMIQDIGGHLVVGLLIAGLITVAVPDSFLLKFANYPLLEMLAMLLVSIPMYVCSTGSIPVAAALMLKGISPGAALVMLIAGPATNMASILVIRKVMGNKSLWIFLLGIITGAVGFGLIINNLMPAEWFDPIQQGRACCTAQTPWWKWTSTIIFSALLINALLFKYFFKRKTNKKMAQFVTYKVGGMSCNHCKNRVESNVKEIEGVTNATVDLAKGELYVEGNVSEETIQKKIDDLGYIFQGK